MFDDLLDQETPAVAADQLEATPESMRNLDLAYRAWTTLEGDRRRRHRAGKYYWGDQWSDTLEVEGQTMTEEEYIRRDGRIPWRMNRIGPTVRNLKGQYRQNESERQAFGVDRQDDQTAEMATLALRHVRRINRMKDLEADQFQEHLIGGKVAFRVGYKWWEKHQRPEVMVQAVHPYRLFYNPDLTDRRLFDLRLVGQLHDLSMPDLVKAFAGDSRAKAQQLQRVYGRSTQDTFDDFDFLQTAEDELASLSFYESFEDSKYRVIECWYEKPAWVTYAHDPNTGAYGRVDLEGDQLMIENQMRQAAGLLPLEIEEKYETIWYGQFLTPHGHVLWQGETPYEHREHPFVLGFAELFDGKTKGVVHDVIDQQRLYNRMIGIMDEAMSTAARGVLMIPEEMIPDGVDPQDFAETYSSVRGVVVYRAKPEGQNALPPGYAPQQIYNNSVPAASFSWLEQMAQDLEYTSGVRGPLMGETPKSGTPNALYQQQILQGSVTNIDFFETYLETIRELDLKQLKTLVQYWTTPRPMITSFGEQVVFDPEQVRGLEMDVAIGNVQDTAVARQLFEDDLRQYLEGQHITFPEFLQVSSHPKSQQLQAIVQRRGMGAGVLAELQAAAQGGDPAAAQLAQQVAAEQAQLTPTG